MKRYISMVLALLLVFACLIPGGPEASAAQKKDKSRAIAIVFDNSGSMYISNNQAWCRATYAMEVFASMLNPGDILQIYPMNSITVGNEEYTRQKPFTISDVSQASKIRDIYTPKAGLTHIETIDEAAEGLKALNADEKYLVILTDGGTFTKNDNDLGTSRTKKELDKRIQALAGETMNVMYLGIDREACMPDTPQSQYFAKKKAENSADVLATLTEMCNLIFGRDSLPKNHISGKNIDFDISMSKVIVFVQGESITDLKLVNASGGSAGKLTGTQQTKFSTKGTGSYKHNEVDDSLQGMVVTYTDCDAGNYTIDFKGNATSIEIYYEPNADLDFVFTDAAGNTVDPNALYAGTYKVSFGMKDAKTGKLIASDLLGNPQYKGHYYINGKSEPITHQGFSGSVDVPLEMGQKFQADLTVTYLSGYTISKDSSGFGWPADGILVAPRPAGDLTIEISGGDKEYSLQNLESGAPYTAKVYYQGTQLTGSELQKVSLEWYPETSNAEIKKNFADDHWELTLHYKDPADPQSTVCGECTVDIYAVYSPPDCTEAQAKCPMTYNIIDDFSPLQMQLFVPESYIVIGELEDSQAMVANLKLNGAPLNAEDFAAVQMLVDTGGIEYTLIPDPQDSSYQIKLLPTAGIKEDNYKIRVTAVYTDHIGRETQVEDRTAITLSNTPLWLKWTIGLLLLLILLLIIWAILHIKVMPSHAHFTKKESKVLVDGEDVTKFCSFSGSASDITVKYGGNKFGLAFPGKAGKESYLCKKQTKRYAEVANPATIKRIGNANIESATIGSVRYVLNDKGVMERKPASKSPLNVKHGMPVIYSGTFLSAGVKKSFNVNAKFNFKKK